MRTFSIAVTGCGGVSRMHFDGYKAHPERLRIVAACDPDAERAEGAKATYGFGQAFTSLEDMIEQADWQVAVVCTPTPVREEVVRVLAAAGKHVFIEKPMAESLAEAERMVQASRQAGVKLAVNQNFRYHYGFDIARNIIAEGQLGKVLTVAHTHLCFRQDRGWRTGCERHALSVMGVHWFDGFRWMLSAEAASLACRMHSSPAIECAGDTDAAVQIAFEGGAVVSFVQSFSSPVRRSETVVVGERAGLLLKDRSVAIYDKEQRGKPRQTWENPYAGKGKPASAYRALEELLAAIERDAEPSNSGRDNLKTIALLDSAYRSASSGAPVALKGGLPV